MAIDYKALQTEIALPAYAASIAIGDDVGVAALLNVVNVNIKLDRGVIPANSFAGIVVLSEFIALTPAQQNYLIMLCSCGSVDTGDSDVKQSINTLFPNGTATQTNWNQLNKRTASRAEQLFGIGTILSHTDIALAKGQP